MCWQFRSFLIFCFLLGKYVDKERERERKRNRRRAKKSGRVVSAVKMFLFSLFSVSFSSSSILFSNFNTFTFLYSFCLYYLQYFMYFKFSCLFPFSIRFSVLISRLINFLFSKLPNRRVFMFVSLCQELLNQTKRKNSWKTFFFFLNLLS